MELGQNYFINISVQNFSQVKREKGKGILLLIDHLHSGEGSRNVMKIYFISTNKYNIQDVIKKLMKFVS